MNKITWEEALLLVVAMAAIIIIIKSYSRIKKDITSDVDLCNLCDSPIIWNGNTWYCLNIDCERHSGPEIKRIEKEKKWF